MQQPTNTQTTPLQKRQKLEEERNPSQNTSKLPGTTIALMLCTTIFLDVAEFLLDCIAIGVVLNIIIDFCVELGFYVWFKSRGLNMAQARKAITFLGGGVLELFFDGAVPLWTLDIGLIIILERAEEYVAKRANKLGGGASVVQKYAQAKGNTQLARTAGGVKSFTERAGQNQASLTKKGGGSTKDILQERSENNAKKRLEKSSPSTKSQDARNIIARREEENAQKETTPIREDPIFIEEERRKKAREDRISKLKDVRRTI